MQCIAPQLVVCVCRLCELFLCVVGLFAHIRSEHTVCYLLSSIVHINAGICHSWMDIHPAN